MLASENKLTFFAFAKPTQVFKFCSNLLVCFFFSLCCATLLSTSEKGDALSLSTF